MIQATTVRILLTSDVYQAEFPAWIAGHACKLGLERGKIEITAQGLTVTARGPSDMIKALALAKSLGPRGVLVATVSVSTVAGM